MNDLTILKYRKLRDGRWEAYDRNGLSAIGFNKDDAKRLYYLYYKMPREPVGGQARNGLIPIENLTLDK